MSWFHLIVQIGKFLIRNVKPGQLFSQLHVFKQNPSKKNWNAVQFSGQVGRFWIFLIYKRQEIFGI